MNIVHIHSHDTGRYLQPYGHAVPTPNLMKLAEEGVLFRQAFCAGPTCSPSRAAFMTGMAPHSNGMIGLSHRGFRLNDYSKHLVNFLNRAGYETALFGTQHEAPDKETAREFINYTHNPDPESEYRKQNKKSVKEMKPLWDINNARLAAKYITEPKARPFFLTFGMHNTHLPFPELENESEANYVISPFPLYDCKENRENMAGFIKSAKIVDEGAGIVLNALEESGLADNTIVIYTTDHGVAFPKMKCNLYDTGIGVSLIMRYPGCPKGKVIDSIVSHIDMFPTLCDFIGQPHPDWLQGVSLLPLIEGKADRIHDEIYSEVTFHAAYEPMRCIRTERYKLIKRFDDYNGHVLANIDESPSKTFLIKHGFGETIPSKEMLFDLYLDPVERVNLMNDDRYSEIYENLSSKLTQWMKETNDPLLQGEVELPPRTKVVVQSSVTSGSTNSHHWLHGTK